MSEGIELQERGESSKNKNNNAAPASGGNKTVFTSPALAVCHICHILLLCHLGFSDLNSKTLYH